MGSCCACPITETDSETESLIQDSNHDTTPRSISQALPADGETGLDGTPSSPSLRFDRQHEHRQIFNQVNAKLIENHQECLYPRIVEERMKQNEALVPHLFANIHIRNPESYDSTIQSSMLNQPQSYMEIFASTDEFREALATQILNAGGLNSVEFIL